MAGASDDTARRDRVPSIGFKQIINQYSQRCLTCEEPIEAGQRVNWTPGAGGIWHLSCEVPKNIATHVRAAEARRKLGLE